jgi:hypothetical protein
MKKVTLFFAVSFTALIVLGMITSASALIINDSTTLQWTGSQTANMDAGDIETLFGLDPGTLDELYKQNVGESSDTGTFAESYYTTFFNTPLDPQDADIKWLEGSPYITGDPLYLYVKDGAQSTAWYIFDLNNISDWNGMDTLELRGFWPDEGAISHVAIYGGEGAPVPEPATMLLLGAGLIGLAGMGRKKLKTQ